MIDAAVKNGADFCKFQTWNEKTLEMVLGTKMGEENL